MPRNPKGKNGEVWERIPGCDNYFVSNFGKVAKLKAYKRTELPKTKQYHLKLLKPWENTSGLVVAIWTDGKRKMRMVKSLVAEVFLGPQTGEKVVFEDGNRLNCNISNLRIAKTSERLSQSQKDYIIDHFLARDVATSDMAERFQCSVEAVRKVIREYQKQCLSE